MTQIAEIEKGSVLSPYINISFVLLFILSFSIHNIKQNYALYKYAIFILFIYLSFLLASVFYEISPFSVVRMFIIPFAAMLIGYKLDLSKIQYGIFSILFLVIISYVAFMQITTNIGAFIIVDNYLVENKNSLGIVIGTGVILSFVLAIEKEFNFWLRLFYIIMAVFLLFCDLTIRARTCTLTAVFLCLYVIYLRNGKGKVLYTVAVLILSFSLILVFVPGVFDYFHASIYSGYEGEDVTSDRLTRNAGAISAILDNPFFCKLNHDYGVHQVHNFFLKTWYEMGLIFGWPILAMYIYQFIDVSKCSIKKCHINNKYSMGFLLGLYPFLNSLAETTLPYGPGTDSVINFILWGIACKQSVIDNSFSDAPEQMNMSI